MIQVMGAFANIGVFSKHQTPTNKKFEDQKNFKFVFDKETIIKHEIHSFHNHVLCNATR